MYIYFFPPDIFHRTLISNDDQHAMTHFEKRTADLLNLVSGMPPKLGSFDRLEEGWATPQRRMFPICEGRFLLLAKMLLKFTFW